MALLRVPGNLSRTEPVRAKHLGKAPRGWYKCLALTIVSSGQVTAYIVSWLDPLGFLGGVSLLKLIRALLTGPWHFDCMAWQKSCRSWPNCPRPPYCLHCAIFQELVGLIDEPAGRFGVLKSPSWALGMNISSGKQVMGRALVDFFLLSSFYIVFMCNVPSGLAN